MPTTRTGAAGHVWMERTPYGNGSVAAIKELRKSGRAAWIRARCSGAFRIPLIAPAACLTYSVRRRTSLGCSPGSPDLLTPMNAVSPIAAGLVAVAAASALSGCAIPSAETLSPFQEPWPWTKIVAVNRSDHDVQAVRVGHCETGPALRQSQSTPSFCFLGKKPERPIAITWNDAGADAQHASTVPLPPLWQENPRPGELTGGYLCVLLRNDARARLTITATEEACAVL